MKKNKTPSKTVAYIGVVANVLAIIGSIIGLIEFIINFF